MLKVNGNDIAYSKSFIMAKDDVVVLTPPELLGVSLRFKAVQTNPSAPLGHDFNVTVSEQEFTVAFGILPGGTSISGDLREYLSTPDGKITVRTVRQGMGASMLVHIDVVFESTQPEGTMQEYLDDPIYLR